MTFDSDEMLKLLDGIRIPPAPYIITRLHSELQKDDPELPVIADIIAQDVGISALVLRTVNSAFFGLRIKVSSIQQAASLLGINNIVNIVAGLALRRAFESSDTANPPNFWDAPVNIAMVSARIAQRVGVPSDEAYLLGLFHNAGHALLMQKHDSYAVFLEEGLNNPDALVTELEEQAFHTNHAVLGYFLAKSWALDQTIVELIRDHHSTRERLSEKDGAVTRAGSLLAVLKIAEHVDKLFWSMNPDHEWEGIKDQVLNYLGMSEPDFIDLRDDMSEMLLTGQYN